MISLSFPEYDPWLRYRFGQGQYYTESASSRKVNAVECILNKTDATVSGGIGQSSNIFLKPPLRKVWTTFVHSQNYISETCPQESDNM